ncbi:MAG: hypothetical protein ACJ768_03935, partial [Gaiellaceae bacterium]
MEVLLGSLIATRNGEVVTDDELEPVRRAHFNLSGVDRVVGTAYVSLRARSAELVGGAAAFALLNLVVLVFVRARLHQIVSPEAGGHTGTEATVAALLAVPGLLLSYVLRPGEHEVV